MYMTKSPEPWQDVHEIIVMQKVSATGAASAKKQISQFLKTVAYNNKEEFLSFSKEHDNLNLFLCNFTDTKIWIGGWMIKD